jgi:hypothetical protein
MTRTDIIKPRGELMGTLGKGFILWIMGIPAGIILLLWLFGILK